MMRHEDRSIVNDVARGSEILNFVKGKTRGSDYREGRDTIIVKDKARG